MQQFTDTNSTRSRCGVPFQATFTKVREIVTKYVEFTDTNSEFAVFFPVAPNTTFKCMWKPSVTAVRKIAKKFYIFINVFS